MIRAATFTLLLLAACRPEDPATEVLVTVDTTLGVPCAIDTLRFEIAGQGEPLVEEIPITAVDLPGSVSLLPHAGLAEATVTVTGLRDGIALVSASDSVTFDDQQSVELRFVLDRTCMPGPCPAVGTGGFLGLPEPVAREGCGEQRYASVPSTFAIRDACGLSATPARVLISSDEEEVASPLVPAMPFPFSFYGTRVDQLWVGSNGYIAFGATAPNALIAAVGAPRSLGEDGFPAAGVLPFWDDLKTGPQGVCLVVSGTMPNRLLWITWKEACFTSGAPCGNAAQGRLTFSVALEETTNRIYVGYPEMTATVPNVDRAKGAFATIGLANKAAKGCAAASCTSEGLCADGITPCGYTEFSSRRIVEPFPVVELRPR